MTFLTAVARVNRFFAYVSGYALLGLSFLIVFEIFARRLFGFSIQGVDELGGYIVATTGTFSFAYGLIERSHTRIDIVLDKVPQSGRAVLNATSFVMVAAAALFMVWYGWPALSESLLFNSRSATPLQTPIWIPQSIWMSGLALFAVTAITMALHAVVLAVRDPQQANQRYGPPSIAEEVEWEMSEAAKRNIEASGTESGR